LNCTHQLLAHNYDVILGGSVREVKVNAEYSVMAITEIGLDVNADKSKCMVKYRGQNAGRCDGMKTDNNSYEILK